MKRPRTYSEWAACARQFSIPTNHNKGWKNSVLKAILAHENSDYFLDKAGQYIAAKKGRERLLKIQSEVDSQVPYSLHPESEVSGELFAQLKQAGFDAKLEVSFPSKLHRSQWMRADIAIFENGRPICAIECKRNGAGLSKSSLQAKAYFSLRDKYGLQIFFVNCENHFEKVFAFLKTRRAGEDVGSASCSGIPRDTPTNP